MQKRAIVQVIWVFDGIRLQIRRAAHDRELFRPQANDIKIIPMPAPPLNAQVCESSWVRPPADYTGAAAGTFVAQKGHKRVAVLGVLDVEFYASYVGAFKKELNKTGGEVVSHEAFGLKDRDMSLQLTKICGQEPDAILVVGYVELAAFIYHQAVELGIGVPRYGFTSGSEEQFLRWLHLSR